MMELVCNDACILPATTGVGMFLSIGADLGVTGLDFLVIYVSVVGVAESRGKRNI